MNYLTWANRGSALGLTRDYKLFFLFQALTSPQYITWISFRSSNASTPSALLDCASLALHGSTLVQLPRSCVTAVESITVLMLIEPEVIPEPVVEAELVVVPVAVDPDDVDVVDVVDVNPLEKNPLDVDPVVVVVVGDVEDVRKAFVETVLEVVLKSDVLVVVVFKAAVGVEDSENDLVNEVELPLACASDVDVVVVVVVRVVKAVFAIMGIIVDMVPVVKNENGQEQEQRHPPEPTVALAAAAVDSCVAFEREADDSAKDSTIEELVEVLDWTLIESTLALEVLFVNAVVVALLSAKDRAAVEVLLVANVDVGVKLVDAAAAVAVEFRSLVAFEFVVDIKMKDRACELVVALLKLVEVVAAAAVAIPPDPESTDTVRI